MTYNRKKDAVNSFEGDYTCNIQCLNDSHTNKFRLIYLPQMHQKMCSGCRGLWNLQQRVDFRSESTRVANIGLDGLGPVVNVLLIKGRCSAARTLWRASAILRPLAAFKGAYS